MNFENFKDQFHESWHNKIKPFIESPECDEIYRTLKERSRMGHRIAPSSFNTFRCFKETNLNNLKVVLLSYCPYHSFVNGNPVADGLTFSCSITNRLQPSLDKFYSGLELEFDNGLNLNYDKSPDLLYLAKQNVLLWNSALTVEKDKAGSHQNLWQPFTKYVLENILAYTGIPIILIGKDAQVYNKYITPLTHGYSFNLEHPSFAARENREWRTEGVFKKVNTLIKQNNGYEIKWLCSKEEMEEIVDEVPF